MIEHQTQAIELLKGLLAVPSLSRQEVAASAWLTAQMTQLGYTRAYVDAAGNAVGEMGSTAARHTLVLLGHIDTVPGNIPVRLEETADGILLYGRGSVDAKGPLATFVAAVARLGETWAQNHGFRIVVVGAVEEEAASSKGARFIRDRFNGRQEPMPVACIIGEPSSWQRVTLGYKGRILVNFAASQPMAHTAGPDMGVATVAVDLWNWVRDYATQFNAQREASFDQFLPSLRVVNTSTDEQMHDHVTGQIGIRLPLDFDLDAFMCAIAEWAAHRITAPVPMICPESPAPNPLMLEGPHTALSLTFYAYEQAWRADRNTFLVRAFLSAVRAVVPGARPGFVVKTGTSDMNVVGPAWRCPILAYGPGDSALDHTPNEHVAVDEYWRAVLVLEQALRKMPELLRE